MNEDPSKLVGRRDASYVAGRATRKRVPAINESTFRGPIMGKGFSGLTKALVAASVCIGAAVPAHAQDAVRYVHAVTWDGGNVRLLQPSPGGGSTGDPGGGRASIRITGLSGIVGIPVAPGAPLDRVIDMANIAYVEDSVPRYELTHGSAEARLASEMFEVLRPTVAHSASKSACVIVGNGISSQLGSQIQAALPAAGNGIVRVVTMLSPSGFSSGHVIAGLSRCMADSTTAVVVIGLVGFEQSFLERAAIEAVAQAGVLVLAPAMSMEHQAADEVAVPGVYSSVTTIGAVEKDGKLAWWSPLSRDVDFVAPAQLAVGNGGMSLAGGQHLALGALMYGIAYSNLAGFVDLEWPTLSPNVEKHLLVKAMERTARQLPSALDRRHSGSGVADFSAAKRALPTIWGTSQVFREVGAKAYRKGADIEIRATWAGGGPAIEVFQNDTDRVTVLPNRNSATFVVRNADVRGLRSLRLCNVGTGGECAYVQAAWGPTMR